MVGFLPLKADEEVNAGSLLTVIGYQLGGLAIAASPIWETQDPVTNWVRANFRLKHGATVGLIVSVVTTGYTALVVSRWVESGYSVLPGMGTSMVAFTALVIGVQTLFISLLLSLLSTGLDDTPTDG